LDLSTQEKIVKLSKLGVVLFAALPIISAQAQEKTFDRAQVNTVSAADRAKIETILKSNRLLSANRSIASEADFRGLFGLPDITIPLPINLPTPADLCRASCDVSAAGAVSACTGLSSGTAVLACTAAAAVSLEACKKGC
jgi:hypothetical protein